MPEPNPNQLPYIPDLETVYKVIQRLDPTSSPGLSGWTNRMIQQISKDDTCLQGVSDLCFLITNSLLPPLAREYFSAEKLLIIYKKKTGEDVRDIHMKDPLLNLAKHCRLLRRAYILFTLVKF